jgi:hypothetical protein
MRDLDITYGELNSITIIAIVSGDYIYIFIILD